MSKKTFFQTEISNLVERNFEPNETLRVLKSNQSIFWSWGVSKLFKYEDKAIFLKVNGIFHNGWVMVTLAWDDTYTFRLLNNHYREVYKETDVYVDVLRDRIDEKVEKQPYYSF